MILRGEIKNATKKKIEIECSDLKLEILLPDEPNINTEFKSEERVVLNIPNSIFSETSSDSKINKEVYNIQYSTNISIEKDPFRYISDLRKDKYITVMAICTSFKPLTSTKGTDSLFSLNILDHSGSIELKVFIKEDEYYKFIQENNNSEPYKPGNVLILRNIKKSSNENFAVMAKPCTINKPDNSTIQTQIKKHLNQLYSSNRNSTLLKSKKIKQIKDLNDKCFFDILGKVIYFDDTEKIPSVCITDYTKNPNIEVCSSSSFPNNMVVVIKLFGHHSSFIDKIKEDQYYLFKNIRLHVSNNLLEAYMHDYLDGDVIEIKDQSMLEDIKNSETAYNEEAKQSKSKEENVGVEFADLMEINQTGIYLCKCLIGDISRSDDGFFQVEIIESEKTYTMYTKSCLSKKIEENINKIEPGTLFKTLVLRSDAGEFYLIDLFLNEKEYDEFLEFYLKEKQSLSN